MNRLFSRANLRNWRATWRDTMLLLREFRAPLIAFALVLIGAGVLYYILAIEAGEPMDGVVHAIYTVLSLSFLQTAGDFPQHWYLQVFYFIMPIIVIGIVAQGLSDFSTLLFNRRMRSKEWQMAIASTYSNHVILVGMGHLGIRVVLKLHDLNQDVVVIELKPRDDLLARVRPMNISVIQDDASSAAVLEAAGVRKAHSIVLCTQNDTLNLQVALKARSINPGIRVVVRIFDEDFADALEQQFGFTALSATRMAAPIFAATATGVEVTEPISVQGLALSLGSMEIPTNSPLSGMSLGDAEQRFSVSIVLVRRNGDTDLHPPSDMILAAQDVIGILGEPDQINAMVRDSR